MPILQTRLLPLTLTLGLCAAANAQREEANLAFTYGVPDFAGAVRLTSFAERIGTGNNFRRSVGCNLSSDVRVFGVTRESCGVDVISSVTQTETPAGNFALQTRSASGSAVVRVGGQTVFSSSGTQDVTVAIPPMNVFPGSGVARAMSVGPFAVVVRANVSTAVNVDLDPTPNVLAMATSMTGFLRSRSNGSATVSVAAAGVSAGVNATLNLADTAAALDLTASDSGLDGTMRHAVLPIRIAMSVFASSFGFTFTQTLFDYALGGRSGSSSLQ